MSKINFFKLWIAAGGAALIGGLATPASALTVEVDGIGGPPGSNKFAKLSEAVTAVYNDVTATPDIVNITVDFVPGADNQILLNAPITINGDGEADGVGNGTPADILVNMASADPVGDIQGKAYFEVSATGEVTINDVRVHPDTDAGEVSAAGSVFFGLFCAKPAIGNGTTNIYTFNRVEFSCSDAVTKAFVRPDTDEDLFTSDTLKWGSRSGGEGNWDNLGGVFQIGNNGPGAGTYSTVFNHCKAAATHGTALNMENLAGGTHQVLGGLYGHSKRDGITILSSENVTIQGTANDRVRVIRAANSDGSNSHSIEIRQTSTVNLLEYIDIAGETSANGIAFRGGTTDMVRFVRILGKFNPPSARNHAVFISTAAANIGTNSAAKIGTIENCTFHAEGVIAGAPPNLTGLIPMIVDSLVDDPITINNTIFTSAYVDESTSNSVFVTSPLDPSVTFSHCALPTDLAVGESLTTEGIRLGTTNTVVLDNNINVSPSYLLTLADYDWSDDQGASQFENGVGNRNVLRPSNGVYSTAGPGGTALTGGAGPALASRVEEWMLM